ncbi:LysE family translocator [Amycolatopsis sp. lyj-109]|uniref:LysE family translocator n=1 Tax=Amycolatopsis sp. lyj-109 TaxID=2789287 RepID=UPI003979B3F2
MIPGATAASFLLVVVLGAMSPGPDFVVVTRSALSGGRRAGIAAGTGIALGVFAWVVAIALGVAAVLTASAVAFTVVKLAGAAYLVVLGGKAWLAVRRGEYRDLAVAGEARQLAAGPRSARAW